MNQTLETTFLEALEQHQHKLLRVCTVYASDADDKKDLFQESLINIWQALPSFEGKSALSTWMFRITLNVCLRLQSREEKKRVRFKRIDSIVIENIQTEETHDNHEQLIKLRSCIQKLNDPDKAVITLFLEDLPYKEISAITGLSENTIAVKLKRIKLKLLTCINTSTL